ncbi:hypothetical protein A9Q99_27090 [Gammaproteobacteria bacterium 45_16_T64]|nr:hypothetical protein A9Q99_27090 [Gammaproteobacteria bacterium 45_16_T64]
MDLHSLRIPFSNIVVASAFLWIAFGAQTSQAQLAQNLMIGNAKALALGNAVTADPPGIDSIHFNPAGLSRLDGKQIHLKFILADAQISAEFTPSEEYYTQTEKLGQEDWVANTNSEIESFAIYLPGEGITEIPFAAAPLGGISFSPPGSRMTFATSVYAPMILGLTRADDDPGIYAGKSLAFTRITFFSPSMAYQLTDTLSVGASIGFSYTGFGLDLDYRSPSFLLGSVATLLDSNCDNPGTDPLFIDLCSGSLGPFDAIFNLQVDVEKAVSTTFNFGVLWEVTPWLTWGFAYQSEANDLLEGDIAVNFDEDVIALWEGAGASFSALEPILDALTLQDTIESKGRINLVTPQHVSTGISVLLTPRVKFNVDVKWTETSVWDSFRFEFDEDINILGLLGELGISGVERNALDIPRGYEDTINWGYGLEYLYTDKLSLRMGYEPRKAGIPDDKLDFIIPLGDMDLYSVGFSYRPEAGTVIDVALAYAQSHQSIPAGSSTNGNDFDGDGDNYDNFVYNPYALQDVQSNLDIIMLELSYQAYY